MGAYRGGIAVDGKTIRGACGPQDGKALGASVCGKGNSSHRRLHIVSAYATELSISLGQVRVDEKSNEITAVPQLLDALDIKGCTITADAMNCQKKIAKKIMEKEGDYILIVKDNQHKLRQWLEDLMESARANPRAKRADIYSISEKGHGRHETRTCYSVGEMELMGQFAKQ